MLILPAAATASMWITRTFFSSLWIACATGSWRCTSMDFDSISPARWRIIGDSFLILFNADHREIAFRLGGRAQGLNWELVLDTSNLALGQTLAVLRLELPPSAQMKSNP